MIKVSAPCKLHFLGEHAVVYGKPAIMATINLRVTVALIPIRQLTGSDGKTKEATDSSAISQRDNVRNIIEPIIKKELGIKKIPPYKAQIESEIPIGSGLGSSAAVSSAYIAALLCYLKIDWDLNLVNKLAYEAEKVFHGNPSGGDNSTIVFGGLIWFRREAPEFKIIQHLPFSLPKKLAKNFILIDTGKPVESTKEMVAAVKDLYDKNPKLVNAFLDDQERLVRKLLHTIKDENEEGLIEIIKEGEKNLETIGVCSSSVQKLIRQIECAGGAAKICGAGGKTKATGIVLAYHKDKKVIEKIAKEFKLNFFSAQLGLEGLRQES